MAPRLDSNHLQLLTHLAEQGTVVEAAAVLGVTPSALTHRIREAERRLGITLYTKLGRRLRPTPAAEMLTAMAQRLLAEQEQVERAATSMGQGITAVIKLTVGGYSAYHWLPGFFESYKRDHQDVLVEVMTGAASRPLMALEDKQIDVAVLAARPLSSAFAAQKLFSDPLVAIFAPDHPLANRPYVEAGDLLDEDVLTYSLGAEPGQAVERFWRPAGVNARRYILVEEIEAIVELVKARFGIAILARWAVAPHLKAGSLKAVSLGREGLLLDWLAVTRVQDGETGPAPVFAQRLATWAAKRGFS